MNLAGRAADRAAPLLIREVLERFGRARLRAYGSSMLPAIQPGDVLTVRHVKGCAARVGDVALFHRGGRLFAHRIIARAGTEIRTRGDAHLGADPRIAESQVLGVVESVGRRGDRFQGSRVPGFLGSLFARLLNQLRRWPNP